MPCPELFSSPSWSADKIPGMAEDERERERESFLILILIIGRPLRVQYRECHNWRWRECAQETSKRQFRAVNIRPNIKKEEEAEEQPQIGISRLRDL